MDEQLKKMAWVYAVNGALAGGNKGKHVFQIADEVVAKFEERFPEPKSDGADEA